MRSLERVAVKRVYEAAADSDGFRILVDRLWPRGLTKEKARVDLWLRDLAPSTELRRWFHEHPENWREFRQSYVTELDAPTAAIDLARLYRVIDQKPRVTLLFASKRTDQNNATVLKEFVEGMKKPPKGTGAGRARVRGKKLA
jgi:uncharacterized protein YeaO (DUF488 family)